MLNQTTREQYLAILKEELVPATGCTEPISLAFCAALARDKLGAAPQRVLVEVSGNVLKNVKSVVVPGCGGLKGIPAAVAAGIVAGRAELGLEVISSISPQQRQAIEAFLREVPITIASMDTPHVLDERITLWQGQRHATVRVANSHTNVVQVEANDETLLSRPLSDSAEDNLTDKSSLNVEDIVAFADTVTPAELEQLIPLLDRQIDYNFAIAKEGLRHDWGACVGQILINDFGADVRTRAKALAAAGSDARMSGCELPVVVLSGSGNQGIAASLPVVAYWQYYSLPKDKLYRALLVSDLITIHQKTGIGRLSAYCGAVSAGCGAGAGIAYLLGGDLTTVAHTLVNALAIVSGIICDGAKPSCAAKIAAAVEAGILGYHMYRHEKQFYGGEGIVTRGVENTIGNVGVLAKEGMRETDQTIIRIMENN